MTVVAWPRKEPLWRRLLALISDPYARPLQGYQGTGFAQAQQVNTVDGARVGDLKWAFGTRDSVLRDNPGWGIADGSTTVVIDGVSYTPDFTGNFILGGDGGSIPVDGNSVVQIDFDIPGSSITQPTFAAPAVTQQPNFAAPIVSVQPAYAPPAAHGNHPLTSTEVLATPGTGVWMGSQVSAVALQAALTHVNESGGLHQPNPLTQSTAASLTPSGNLTRTNDVALAAPARTQDVVIQNVPMPTPSYVAAWPLLKTS